MGDPTLQFALLIPYIKISANHYQTVRLIPVRFIAFLTDFRTSGGYNLSLFFDNLNFDYQLPTSPLSNIPSSVQSVLFANLY
jgi:hypothetical protein